MTINELLAESGFVPDMRTCPCDAMFFGDINEDHIAVCDDEVHAPSFDRRIRIEVYLANGDEAFISFHPLPGRNSPANVEALKSLLATAKSMLPGLA